MKYSREGRYLYTLYLLRKAPHEILNDISLSKIDVEKVYELSKVFLEACYGDIDTNNNLPVIYPLEFIYIIFTMEHMTTSMSVHPFLPFIYYEALSLELYSWQILFDIRENNICPIKIRINGQVKGIFSGNCSLSLENDGYNVRSFMPQNFELEEDEITPYHITVMYRVNEASVYYNIIVQGVNLNNTGNNKLNEILMTEKQFIEYCTKNNLSISVRTLYVYRERSIFPEPYQIKINGKKVNHYNPDWIKYIKLISDEKKKHGNPWIMKNLRAKNKAFFRNIPIKKK